MTSRPRASAPVGKIGSAPSQDGAEPLAFVRGPKAGQAPDTKRCAFVLPLAAEARNSDHLVQ